jgi:ppGpp synthetase/RelA/SpoT-type nucleotidyltranferase
MAEENSQEQFLKDFDEMKPIYEAFTQKVEGLVRELLTDSSLVVHSVTSRTKTRKSFRDKLSRGAEKYRKLEDITDLSGVRITCWFLDQIPLIEKIIKENFSVDDNLSIDKGEVMDPDRFGYVSVHYIVSLSANRAALQEFKKYAGLYCEIQIRTILQHAWAEIEHDLGYKSKIEIPKSIKRRFYRLASIFELADDEFQRLKKDIEAYSETVTEKIKKKEQGILIDKTSLESYAKSSGTLENIDNAIVDCFMGGAKVGDVRITERELEILAFFDIQTIERLDMVLRENSADIIKFAKKWIKVRNSGIIHRGIGIFYLGYTLAAKTRNDKKIKEYTEIFSFRPDRKVSERLMAISRQLYSQKNR